MKDLRASGPGRVGFLSAGLIAAVLCVLASGCWGRKGSTTKIALPSGPGVEEFQRRVQAYAAVHARLASRLPPLAAQATAEQIRSHQEVMAKLIREERASAKQGDFFEPATLAFFREVLRTELGRGAHARRIVNEENPAALKLKVPVSVNAAYPPSVPLSSMPATLLLRLPKLAQFLQYHFVGRSLVLLDVEANLILDFIPDAFR